MKILVTGGAGFLGSHLCERLLHEGKTVVCLDNFYTGARENIAHLKSNPKFSVIEHDVVHPIDIACDQIYNLACPASPVHYQGKAAIDTMKTSVLGALNMLDLAVKHNAILLQASTSEIYGDPTMHPQPETYHGNVNPIGPRACYDEGKRAAETLCFDYHRHRGARIKVMRIFNTYGPRMHEADGRVVSNFIVQALRGEDITVYGDGQQTRSFCYVSDLIEFMVRFMASPDNIIGPLNAGNPGEFTMLELAEKVLKLTGSPSKIIHKPLPADDPKQRRPDITRAGEQLGWQSAIALEDGLKETIGYFRTKLGK
jgi:UDP-glucuronate decarboxylase